MINNPLICYGAARNLAEAEAATSVGKDEGFPPILLSERYLESENCWMFFLKKNVITESEKKMDMRWAYMVTKKGLVGVVQDFSDDVEKLDQYMRKMTDYYKRKDL